METLSYDTLAKSGYSGYILKDAPERLLQFGEGNFLRAFVDYFVDVLNEKAGFNGKAVLAQPIAQGLAQPINQQQGLYTLYLRGFQNGARVNHKRVISCVSRCINPYQNFDALLECAKNPQLRFIASNTTEAGIVYDPSAEFDGAPPASFPAKLARFLYQRFTLGLPGFIILSCELIDNNGKELARCVKQHVRDWNLGEDFARWVEEENLFCSTLVDRIVTGYPQGEADALNAENGYIDNLIDTGEVFGFWVIEGPQSILEELPFNKAGLPVLVTDDHTPYKQRKVRILNGSHTAMVMAALLAGQSIVRSCMEDDTIRSFMEKAIYDEIIPTLTLPREELMDFAASVTERYKNPFIDHKLLDIALNTTAKWRARVLPSLQGYYKNTGALPACLTFSFAAYIAFYQRGNGVRDDDWVLDFFAQHKNDSNAALAQAVAENTRMWGQDLSAIPGFVPAVGQALDAIDENAYAAMKACL